MTWDCSKDELRLNVEQQLVQFLVESNYSVNVRYYCWFKHCYSLYMNNRHCNDSYNGPKWMMLSSSEHFNTWFGSSLRVLANGIIIQCGTIGTWALAGWPRDWLQSLAPPTCLCLALEHCRITSDLEISVRVDDTRLQLHLPWKPHDKTTVSISVLQWASFCKCAQMGGSLVDQFWFRCSI